MINEYCPHLNTYSTHNYIPVTHPVNKLFPNVGTMSSVMKRRDQGLEIIRWLFNNFFLMLCIYISNEIKKKIEISEKEIEQVVEKVEENLVEVSETTEVK